MKLSKPYQIIKNTTFQTIYSMDADKQETKLNKLGDDITFWLVIPSINFNRRYSIKSCPKWVKDAYEAAISTVPSE